VKRTALLALGVLAWLALGPWGLLAVLAALTVPAVRRGLRPTWRFTVALGAVVAVATVTVLALPDGRLPLPPGPGRLVTPSYLGSPATAAPVVMDVPQHPHLARNGTSSMHNDAWASDAYSWAGPLGHSPAVDTAWFGIEECATLAFDSAGDLVALCGSLRGPTMHLLDAESMTKLDTFDLPGRPAGRDTRPWEDLCAGAYFYLDDQDRAVVATTDRRVLVLATRDEDGDRTLERAEVHELGEQIPTDDCLVAVLPDWEGRIWFGTEQGRLGAIDPDTGEASTLQLGEELANSFAVDEDGGVYVVTDEALYRLQTGPGGRATVAWRAAYDRGTGRKPGQFTRGSGTTPTVLPGGLVAITDNAEPRMNVVVHRTRDGSEVCRVPVLAKGASATENTLVSVGDGVVVENNYGYDSPLSTTFGRTTTGGIARVDVSADGCSLAWASDEVAPSSVPKVSLTTGLLYVYTTRPSPWLVTAWYLTAIDVRTGETRFSVRTGSGPLANNHYAAVTLAPDGSAYVATLGGLVRVRDE
jgi:outer membrane protein assembly factor BamB